LHAATARIPTITRTARRTARSLSPSRKREVTATRSEVESLSGHADASSVIEEVGFGSPERRLGWRSVQVLGGDGAPVRAGAQLLENDRDDAVHPPNQD
jgi:hypothetical protein